MKWRLFSALIIVPSGWLSSTNKLTPNHGIRYKCNTTDRDPDSPCWRYGKYLTFCIFAQSVNQLSHFSCNHNNKQYNLLHTGEKKKYYLLTKRNDTLYSFREIHAVKSPIWYYRSCTFAEKVYCVFFLSCTVGGVYVACIYSHARWSYRGRFRSLLLCPVSTERS